MQHDFVGQLVQQRSRGVLDDKQGVAVGDGAAACKEVVQGQAVQVAEGGLITSSE